jgi:hypothetical protein
MRTVKFFIKKGGDVAPPVPFRRLSREHFGDIMINDHNSHISHASQLRCRFLVESPEDFLNKLTVSESSGERNFSSVANFLPVEIGHQYVCNLDTMNIVDRIIGTRFFADNTTEIGNAQAPRRFAPRGLCLPLLRLFFKLGVSRTR